MLGRGLGAREARKPWLFMAGEGILGLVGDGNAGLQGRGSRVPPVVAHPPGSCGWAQGARAVGCGCGSSEGGLPGPLPWCVRQQGHSWRGRSEPGKQRKAGPRASVGGPHGGESGRQGWQRGDGRVGPSQEWPSGRGAGQAEGGDAGASVCSWQVCDSRSRAWGRAHALPLSSLSDLGGKNVERS